MAYPKGEFDELSYTVLSQLGIKVSFTTVPETATVVKGMPQSLLNLPRYAPTQNTSIEQLLEMVKDARG